MKEQRVYEALARGQSVQTILPELAADLGVEALVLYFMGESEATPAFTRSSMSCLEKMKDELLTKIAMETRVAFDASEIQLTLSENHLMQLGNEDSLNTPVYLLISFQEEVVGGLALCFPEGVVFDGDAPLGDFLTALGFARRIETTRLLHQDALDRLDRLAQAGRIFSEGLSLDRTLVRLLEVAVDIAGTGAGVFVVNSGADEKPMAPIGWGIPAEWVAELRLSDGSKLVEAVIRDGKARYLENVESLEALTIPTFLHALVLLPVAYEGGTLGCLCIPNPPPRFFESEAERRALVALASFAGGAIRSAHHVNTEIRAERLREEMRLAAYVQTTLLPRELPTSGEVEAAAVIQPALHLGGDFYDLMDLGNGRWGMMIADVSGKGASAAILMATARAYLHAFSRDGLRPAEVLRRINDALVRDLSDGRFLTGIYLLMDLKAGKLHIAGGGHHPVFLLHPEKGIDCIPCDDLPLGIMRQEQFAEATIDFPPGTMVVLYTDGLIEAKSLDGHFFGSERMYPVLKELIANSPQEVVSRLMSEVKFWIAGQPFPDDLTILAVRAN